MKQLLYAFVASLTLLSSLAIAIPLDLYTTWVPANPNTSNKGQWVQLMARGSGTNDMYVMEVDPTTGAIPVTANVVFSNDTNYGVVGNNTLRTAAQIGNATGAADFNAGNTSAQTLRVVVASDQTAINVVPNFSVVNFGATTSAQRVASILGNSTGELSYNVGNASAQTPRVVIASDQPAITVAPSVTDFGSTASAQRTAAVLGNSSGQIDYNAGAASAQTPRVVIATDQAPIDVEVTAALPAGNNNIGDVDIASALPAGNNNIGDVDIASALPAGTNNIGSVDIASALPAGANNIGSVNVASTAAPTGRSYSDSSRLDYSSTNVTQAAWVQLDASTAALINSLTIFHSCSGVLELGVGGSGSEARVALIPPGGFDGAISLVIPAATRLSLRALSAGDSCTAGQLVYTGFN